MPDNPEQFSAVDPALGYLYQVRCALLWSLQRLTKDVAFEVSIEVLDDVAFETNGMAAELLQTKLHKNLGANLSNASPDLWKTIRIWIAQTDAGQVTSDTVFYLVTTEKAAPCSISGNLKSDTRDIEAALNSLETVARSSTNHSNTAAYAAYLQKTPAERRSLLERVFILDSAPDISDLDDLLQKEIFHAAGRSHQKTFLTYLEGWWFRRVVKQLRGVATKDRILSEELESQMADLRDKFRQDSLPISDDLLHYELDVDTAEGHQCFPFVQQVRLATDSKPRVLAAIRDYYRAFVQRSRWQREDLLFVGDLTTYEKALSEEWELVFAAVEDKIGIDATEVVRKSAAQEVLGWAEVGDVKARIKPGVTNPFITRGSLHILANDLRVGWHPNFLERLQHLLEGDNQ